MCVCVCVRDQDGGRKGRRERAYLSLLLLLLPRPAPLQKEKTCGAFCGSKKRAAKAKPRSLHGRPQYRTEKKGPAKVEYCGERPMLERCGVGMLVPEL